jgi:chromosome segregation ATPase
MDCTASHPIRRIRRNPPCRTMRAVSADDLTPEAEPEPEKHRNAWIWVSAVLALLAIGLLVWALSLKSDLDGAHDDLAAADKQVSSAKQELDKAAQETPAPAPTEEADDGNAALLAAGAVAAKALYDDLSDRLGATEQDLAETEKQLDDAKKQAEQAEKDAAAAEKRAGEASNETEKAQAEADQAQAEADAANAKLAIAKDCAKSYIASVGALLDAEDPEAKAAELREQFQSITADCKAALEGS